MMTFRITAFRSGCHRSGEYQLFVTEAELDELSEATDEVSKRSRSLAMMWRCEIDLYGRSDSREL